MDTFNTDAQPLAQKASKVAIITRTKNRNLLLDRCIRSVLAQTEQDWVHVIVNDGGEAAPLDELISAYQAQYRGRLKVIHNPVSVGMEAASNIGINNSESTYLVILDDDDTWHAKFLEKMTAALATETWAGTRGMFCHTRIVHEKIVGESVVITGSEEFNNWIEHIDFLQLFAWNRFTPVCFVFERAALEEVGLFDETLPVCGDWEFNLRFLSKYEIGTLREELAYWHQRPKLTGHYGNSVNAGQDLHRVYRARIINRWVRQGFADKTLGYADMFSMAISFEQSLSTQRYLQSRKRSLYTRLRKKIQAFFRRKKNVPSTF
ncbi:GT2 family glycosyltransferase [Comamonas sp. BIGb0124]|uniref:glycosyltransferase family 2 protein n=1 Tax=Comamonas sp. BIGb0124 TaxID=2485130 RepID=UPI000F49649F|nr:glycosyltransferase family 2 protein [Comamonas sp. BIGb0124]ROR20201.1 GT2 family glycosyltransferase [Comamonas sp. BIGb0124]